MDLSNAPPLSDQRYADLYSIRKAASTMTSETIQWFLRHTTSHLNRTTPSEPRPFSILSVGPGSGDIDFEIIRTCISAIAPSTSGSPQNAWTALRYVALEPNDIHRHNFVNLVDQQLQKPHSDFLDISFSSQTFDRHILEQPQLKYDLILFVHVLYYFRQPQITIHTALDMLRDNGNLIIVHQTHLGVPQIQSRYMRNLKGNENELMTTADINSHLRRMASSFRYEQLDAVLDVTECISNTQNGRDIMSFCMECDLDQLDTSRLESMVDAFRQLAKRSDDGTMLIHEPVGIFTVDAPATKLYRSPDDTDPVDDYRHLSQSIDWNSLLSRRAVPLRVLDVACGRGRWLDAFGQYALSESKFNPKSIHIDFLDPSETALNKISVKRSHVLRAGRKYVSTIQEADLDMCTYDVLWSMHGFYAVPQKDLDLALQKCFNSLTKTGVAVVAQPTASSFYITLHEQYIRCVMPDRRERLTCVDDVTQSLERLGIEYRVRSIMYEERIDKDDIPALARYVVDESIVNAFNRDDDLTPFMRSAELQWEDLLKYESMKSFMQSFVRGNEYCFPEEVHLVSFGNRAVVKELPSSFGI